VVGAGTDRYAHLFGEALQFLGVILEVLGPLGAHDATRLAGVGARDDGSVLGKFEKCLLVGVRSVGFGRGDEARSHPYAVGTEGQRRRETASVEQSTRGDDRDLVAHRVDNLGHECHGRDGTGVTTALGPLRDDEIATTRECRLGVSNLSAHRTHEDVVRVKHIDDLAGNAETRDEDARATLDDAVDVFFQLSGDGREQIDSERLRCQSMNGGDLLVELSGSHRSGAERADTTGLAHGSDEL